MGIKKFGLKYFFLCLVWNVQAGAHRNRRQACQYGVYTWENSQCCHCPKGYHVKQHCSTIKQTECVQCEHGTFMNHPNGGTTCERCKHCQSEKNLEVEEECTTQSDTVCHCQTGFFCDKGKDCYLCYPCEKCEGQEVEVPCTVTNNTVCSKKGQGEHQAALIVPIAIVVILLIIAGVLWKKGCFKNCTTEQQKKEEDTEEMVLLPDDVDLTCYLSKVASILKLQVVKSVARSSLTEVEVERHEINYRDNAEEQAYKLLEAWHQKHGQRGACNALIKALKEAGKNTDASHVLRIIKEGEEQKMM